MNELMFVKPDITNADKIAAFRESFISAGETEINGSRKLIKYDKAEDWLLTFPSDNNSELFFVARKCDGKYIGITEFRLRLDDTNYQNGHAGASVAPEERRQGYGAAILRMNVEYILSKGIIPAIISCDEDNRKSMSVIEANGGKRLDRIVEAHGNVIIRYSFTGK